MSKKIDLTGMQFGRLTVVCQDEDYIAPSGCKYTKWLCKCNCGNEKLKSVIGSDLKQGKVKSCGCLLKESAYNMGKTTPIGNKYDISGEYGVLWLTNTNNEVYFDLEDADKILEHTWYESVRGYPSSQIDGNSICMHQFLGLFNHDHENRNKLDNRKLNLRPCSQLENSRNRNKNKNNKSGFTGVYWNKQQCKWVAQIKIKQKTINIGSFNDKIDAIKARLKAEKEIYKEFAPQRHLFEQYNI